METKPERQKLNRIKAVLAETGHIGAIVLCLINLIYMIKIQSDIKDLQYSVENINTDYDNSDVINAIEDAEGNIIGSVEDAESNIRRNLIIWCN